MNKLSIAVITGLLFFLLPLWGCRPPATSPVMKDPESILFPVLRFDPPSAERIELDNGMILFFMENREIPLVRLTALSRGGSAHDPPGMEGLADITATSIRTGGTVYMCPDSFDDELDYLAADLDVSVTAEAMMATLTVSKDNFDRALELFKDMLMAPSFSPDRLELARSLKIEELLKIPDNPQRLAFREFTKILYNGTPWGSPSSPASLKALARDDCVDFHRRHLFPGNIMIAVTGDAEAEEIKNKLTALFKSWENGDPVSAVDAPPARDSGPLYYLQRDVPQSVIIAGHVGPGKKSPDYYAMTVLDFIIGGGGFRSRMFMEIRTQRGLAYSAGSFYNPRSDFGAFAAYAMTGTASTSDVIDIKLSILEDMSKNAVDDETLGWAKNSLKNSFIFSFTSAHQIALGEMINEFDGLPRNFLRDYTAGIDAVTAEDVRKAAEVYLDSGHRTLLVLGDAAIFNASHEYPAPVLKIQSDLVEIKE